MYIIHETAETVAIATPASNNVKTGSMLQIWIMARNVHPVESRRTGHDSTLQCAGCPYASNDVDLEIVAEGFSDIGRTYALQPKN